MHQIQQLAAAERHLVQQIDRATNCVAQIGTIEIEAALNRLSSTVLATEQRLAEAMLRMRDILDGAARTLAFEAGKIRLDIEAAAAATVEPVTATPEPAPAAPIEGSPEACPQCGPYVEVEQLTPTARKCRSCNRQWFAGLAGVEVRDDDDTIDIGWDGTTLHPDLAEPAAAAPVNRVASVPTTAKPKPSTNGRKRR